MSHRLIVGTNEAVRARREKQVSGTVSGGIARHGNLNTGQTNVVIWQNSVRVLLLPGDQGKIATTF